MNVTEQTSAVELARRFAELGQPERACQAYGLALKQAPDPDTELEAAVYLLQFGEDYKAAYDAFLDLYRRDICREDCLNILAEAFYLPNEKELKARYEKNCRLLTKYDYCFRKDFLPFEDLPIRFYPYDQQGYLPFHRESGTFDDYVNFNYEVVSRNFFKDLEKPILAEDVYSQYELEYLNDNVRKSEWVGRENHLYLHYTDWAVFCSYLQVLEWRELLAQKKLVLLIEDELSQYPIDFKERFGIDYSQYPVKPVGIREVNKVIWHTQLSFHNGGDFFNEIFDAHPNLVYMDSQFFDELEVMIAGLREDLKACHSLEDAQLVFEHWKKPWLVEELYHLKNRTDKDILVAMYMAAGWSPWRDPNARIAPALFFQPHFGLFRCDAEPREGGELILKLEEYDRICASKMLQGFKYIKTFTPMRRPTTSYAASIKFMATTKITTKDFKKLMTADESESKENETRENSGIMVNMLALYILNRSYMTDNDTRALRDSVLVRFEDGKLNPTATFTALCSFVDLPYTESMTYCSELGLKDPHPNDPNWYAGFSLTGVYKTYDEYAGDAERCYIEYLLRDAYEQYGYDFHYYDGKPMDEERLRDMTDHFDVFYGHAYSSFLEAFNYTVRSVRKKVNDAPEVSEESIRELANKKLQSYKDLNFLYGKLLMQRGLRFVNKNGRPLKMMKKLELDPELLEQPLYH